MLNGDHLTVTKLFNKFPVRVQKPTLLHGLIPYSPTHLSECRSAKIFFFCTVEHNKKTSVLH